MSKPPRWETCLVQISIIFAFFMACWAAYTIFYKPPQVEFRTASPSRR
jgi:hypothetical protein